MAHMTKIQQARSRLLIHQTFWAQMVLAIPLFKQSALQCPTMQTDMKTIWYSDEFVDSIHVDVVMFALAHEVCHIMLFHGLRKGNRNHKLWNIACDYAVNAILKDCGFALWDKCYYDARFAGMSAEKIYDIFEQKGGGAQSDDGGMPGDIMEPGDLSPEERIEIEQTVRQTVAQAANLARQAGQLPSGLARLVNGILNPVVPWWALLRNHMTKLSRTSYTWSRRNHRIKDFFIPLKRGRCMGELVVIGDTSGSIGNEVFARVAAEIQSAAEQVRPERIRVIWADAEACSSQQVFEPGDPIIMKPTGGGGTDMRLPMKYVERYDPIVVVMITDAETPWPNVPPPYPFIVLCTTRQKIPNYAQVVRLP